MKIALVKNSGIEWLIHKIIKEALLSGLIWLPLTADHIELYLSIPLFLNHKDSLDWMLLATALADDLTVVSSDYNFLLHSNLVTTIW